MSPPQRASSPARRVSPRSIVSFLRSVSPRHRAGICPSTSCRAGARAIWPSVEPLRSLLYAKVASIGPNLDGKIDHDVAGRLSGNWFTSGGIPLVFAYETQEPARVLIAVSGELLRNGLYSIAATDPLPRDVSVASGLIRYTLAPGRGAPSSVPPPPPSSVPIVRLLVQMLDDQSIRVEMFPLAASADAFTSSAKTFLR